GRITDSKGVTVDFKNTIIIMTSNLGSQYAFEPDKQKKEKLYMDLVKATFKPEFINRIDDIIVFNPLSNDVLGRIVDKFMGQLAKRLEDQNIRLEVTDRAKQQIIDEGSDISYGARPLKRYIQQNIETVLAYKILEDNIEGNTVLVIDFDGSEYTVKEKEYRTEMLS
ncbi:MAG: ATP-dependent Clp protease ATP-binding subunit, partial [Erysipelotrichaceae bacterium]|nr:ATP-dependent Clp protease ATP-binding subunit [Erysipelotrichaceae bacterium]